MPLPDSGTSGDLQVRFEARIKDASDLEVTGSAIAVATWGDFLIAARATPSVAKPGTPVQLRLRAIDYRGGGSRRHPGCRATRTNHVGFEHAGTASRGRDLGHDDHRRRWTGEVATTAPSSPGSYLIEARAMSGTRAVTDSAYVWVPGATDETDASGSESIELLSDKGTYAPGETAKVAVRGVGPTTRCC